MLELYIENCKTTKENETSLKNLWKEKSHNLPGDEIKLKVQTYKRSAFCMTRKQLAVMLCFVQGITGAGAEKTRSGRSGSIEGGQEVPKVTSKCNRLLRKSR